MDTHSTSAPYVQVSVDGIVTGTSMECPWTLTLHLPPCPSICGWHCNWDVHGTSMDTHPTFTPHVQVSVDGIVTEMATNGMSSDKTNCHY